WDKLHDPFVERAFLAWLDAFRPQVVHVHHWARLTTTLVACCRLRGVPVVLSLHDLFSSCPRYHRVKADLSFCDVPPSPDACRHCAPRWRFQGDAEIDASVSAFAAELREEVALADALLAPTEGHGRRLLAWLGLQRELTVLPPASEVALFPASRPLGGRVARPGDPLRVGTFGHLHPLKGVEVLLDAQAALPDPSLVELHVWGAAPDAATEAALRARAGARPVVWHGAYSPADLSAAPVDAVVLPTLCAESYSFALDEACALGVPVLATDLGALADRATPRLSLFPRGDAATLARALQRLALEPAPRAAMSAAPAPPRQSSTEHLAQLLPIYARLAAAGCRREPTAAERSAEESALSRRERFFALREASLQELLRSEGWEDVVASLRAENEGLRGRPA
ncbi:MAG TPA: glycosyltransferase, partial [Planctomycetota bacterium]|nr:glycosyltransferase [Planctomycetota bacterium]